MYERSPSSWDYQIASRSRVRPLTTFCQSHRNTDVHRVARGFTVYALPQVMPYGISPSCEVVASGSLHYWSDVVVPSSPRDQTSCSVLNWLEALKMDVGDASQQRVTVIQATHNKSLD